MERIVVFAFVRDFTEELFEFVQKVDLFIMDVSISKEKLDQLVRWKWNSFRLTIMQCMAKLLPSYELMQIAKEDDPQIKTLPQKVSMPLLICLQQCRKMIKITLLFDFANDMLKTINGFVSQLWNHFQLSKDLPLNPDHKKRAITIMEESISKLLDAEPILEFTTIEQNYQWIHALFITIRDAK